MSTGKPGKGPTLFRKQFLDVRKRHHNPHARCVIRARGSYVLAIRGKSCVEYCIGVTLQSGQQAAISAIPDTGGAVVACGDDAPPVWRKLCADDFFSMVPENGQ